MSVTALNAKLNHLGDEAVQPPCDEHRHLRFGAEQDPRGGGGTQRGAAIAARRTAEAFLVFVDCAH